MAGDELLDLALALAGGCGRELADVLLGEVIPQEHERREMNGSRLDLLEEDRKPLHQAGRVDPPERRALAHAEPAPAEVEHRRACRPEMETSFLDLDEMHDEPRREAMPLETDRLKPLHELAIREIGEVHATLSTIEIFAPRCGSSKRVRAPDHSPSRPRSETRAARQTEPTTSKNEGRTTKAP